MKKIISKKRKKWVGTLLSLAASFCVIGAAFAIKDINVNATNATVVLAEELKERYLLGEDFTVPTGKISFEGVEYDPDDVSLQYPNGEIKSLALYNLTEVGRYTIVYSKKIESAYVTAEKQFNVYQPYYSGFGADCAYRERLNMNETVQTSGLGVSIAGGGEFVFNQPIDVSHYTENDVAFHFYSYNYTNLMGQSGTKLEASRIIVRMTDCYDETNYVDVVVSWGEQNPTQDHIYYRAGATGQTTVGLSVNDRMSASFRRAMVDGIQYVVDDREQWGTPSQFYMSSGVHEHADNSGFLLYYDNATKKIFVEDVGGYAGKKYFVTDLDEPSIYGENTFKGFSTGEVYFSVRGEEYAESKMNVEIEKIGDYACEDFASLSVIEDNVGPTIVLTDVNETDTIYTVKGAAFTIPSATSFDWYPAGDVKTYVYKNYGLSNQTQVPLTAGKSFDANSVGKYTIVYVATDAFGNESKKTLNVTAREYTIDKAVVLETNRLQNTVSAGETYALPEYSIQGLNGDVYLSIYALSPNAGAEKTFIDLENRIFFPDEIGEWKIVYEYGDQYHHYEYAYEVNVASSENAMIYLPNLPEYFIKNAPYTVGDNRVKIFTGTKAEYVESEVFIKEDDGEFVKVADFEKVVVRAAQTVQFRFDYNENSVYSNIIPVVDVQFDGALKVEEYFYGDFTKEATATQVVYTSKENQGDTRLDFVNAISLNNFILAYKIPVNQDNFQYLTIALIDYENRNNSVEISYGKAGETAYFSVNGEKKLLDKKFTDTACKLVYDKATRSFTIGNSSIKWNNSFSGDKVLLHISLNEMAGESAIAISQINNQGFTSNIALDRAKPEIVYNNVYGKYEVGCEIRVFPAAATDVLSPFLKERLTFSLVAPDGGFVKSTDDIVLDEACPNDRCYDFKVDQSGTYYAVYTYTDFKGNQTIKRIPIQIDETVAPTLQIVDCAEGEVLTGTLGETITVSNYTVQDNQTSEAEIRVIINVFSPIGEMYSLVDSNSFKAELKGRYKVVYSCFDKVGNYTRSIYYIDVE